MANQRQYKSYRSAATALGLGLGLSFTFGCSAPVDGAGSSSPPSTESTVGPTTEIPVAGAVEQQASSADEQNDDGRTEAAPSDPLASLSAEARASMAAGALTSSGVLVAQALGSVNSSCAYFYNDKNYGGYIGALCAWKNGNYLPPYNAWNDRISAIAVGGSIKLYVCTELDCRLGGTGTGGNPNQFAQRTWFGAVKIADLTKWLLDAGGPNNVGTNWDDRISFLKVIPK